MKIKRLSLLLLAVCAVGMVSAQNAREKAIMAEVRAEYNNAQQLAEKCSQETTKNSQVFTSIETTPNGRAERTVEFIFDNSELDEQFGLYPCQLVMIREKIGDAIYREFLFNKEGNLRFFFGKYMNDGRTTEQRFYYSLKGEDSEVYSIEKTTETATGKVLTEEKNMGELGESGNALFMCRVASDLSRAFDQLNIFYD